MVSVQNYADDDLSSHGGAYFIEVLMFGLNRVHWIELSAISALLVWICGQLAGINDIFQLVGLMMLTVTGILASGLLQEHSNSSLTMYSRKMMMSTPGADVHKRTADGWWMDYRCVVSWWPYLLGTIPYLTVWSFLFAYLGIEAQSVPTSSLLPWYVWSMVIGVGVLGLFFWVIIMVRFFQLQSSVNRDRKKRSTEEEESKLMERSMKSVVEYNYYYELWKQVNKAVIILYATWIMFAAMFY
jgi:low affinity Fe/Cu permease